MNESIYKMVYLVCKCGASECRRRKNRQKKRQQQLCGSIKFIEFDLDGQILDQVNFLMDILLCYYSLLVDHLRLTWCGDKGLVQVHQDILFLSNQSDFGD